MKKLIFPLIFIIMGLMLTVNTIAKPIVTDDLVGYWTFDEGTILEKRVEDVWGENDATIVGNPKKVDGYVKGGLKLDGDGDYVSLPNIGNFGRKIGEYTFEAWIKTSQIEKWSTIYRVVEGFCAESNLGTGILINATWVMDLIRESRLNKIGQYLNLVIIIEKSDVLAVDLAESCLFRMGNGIRLCIHQDMSPERIKYIDVIDLQVIWTVRNL